MISEPHDYVCNGLGNRLDAASASTLAAGMFLALLSVVYSALRAGSNTALFGFGETTGSEAGEAMESLMEKEEGTSAGLDGETAARRPRGAYLPLTQSETSPQDHPLHACLAKELAPGLIYEDSACITTLHSITGSLEQMNMPLAHADIIVRSAQTLYLCLQATTQATPWRNSSL